MSAVTHAVLDRHVHTHAVREKKNHTHRMRTYTAHEDKEHTQISTYYKRRTGFIHVMCMHTHGARYTHSNLVLPGCESDWGCLTYIFADMYTEEMKSLSIALPLSVPYPVFFSVPVHCLLVTHTYTQPR